jgi:hypothetical protein
MKMSQVLAIPHQIIDSVTPESFAKDTGACLVVGKRLIKDCTNKSGFAETEKIMPVLSLIPKQKKRKQTESSVKFDTTAERRIIDGDSERAKRIERYRNTVESRRPDATELDRGNYPLLNDSDFEINDLELTKKQIAFCTGAIKSGLMQEDEFEDDE